jgi:excisionase family DNA binding protein
MIKKVLPPENRTIFNASEACGYINLSWNTLKRLIDNGEIRVVRIGKRYLIPKESLDNFIQKDALLARVFLKEINS